MYLLIAPVLSTKCTILFDLVQVLQVEILIFADIKRLMSRIPYNVGLRQYKTNITYNTCSIIPQFSFCA